MDQLELESTEPITRQRLREVSSITVPDLPNLPNLPDLPDLPDDATGSMLDGLAGLHSFVLAVDSELRVVWLSDTLGVVLGGTVNSVGRPVASLVEALWPDDLAVFNDQTRQFVDEMIAKNRVSRARIDLRRDGTALPLEVSAFHIHDSAGNDFVVCVADQHENRECLELKNEELEAYVRSVSHDLRSPLVSLLGFSGLLRNDYREVLDEAGLHFLDRIEQAGRNMKQLLHDMLELSRIEENPHCRVHVNPTPVLQQLSSELKLQLDEKEIELRLPDDPPTVLCDRTQLYQLLSNLIGNAVQHMASKVRGRVDVEFRTLSDGWQISVRDNGPGIPREDRDRIFEAFQTVHRSGECKKQGGLGLTIVKKIVEAHSGRVWIESEPDAGTCFFVWLPKG